MWNGRFHALRFLSRHSAECPDRVGFCRSVPFRLLGSNVRLRCGAIDGNRPILLKKSGHPADASESRKCWRGEAPQIILRRIKSKATHSPRRWRLEKPLEIRHPDFFNRIDPQRSFDSPQFGLVRLRVPCDCSKHVADPTFLHSCLQILASIAYWQVLNFRNRGAKS